jgi:hypothetical protein
VVFEAAPLWLRSCPLSAAAFGADANSAWLCSKEPFAIDDGLLCRKASRIPRLLK